MFRPEAIRYTLQQVIANDLKIDVKYLRKAWGTEYNPHKHLFGRDRNGRQTSIWFLDISTWELIGDAYCKWMLVYDCNKFKHWQIMLDLVQHTPEWAEASTEFKQWLIKKSLL